MTPKWKPSADIPAEPFQELGVLMETLHRGMGMASEAGPCPDAQGSASLAMGAWHWNALEQSRERLCPPGAAQPSVLFPGDTSTQLTAQGMKCLWISSQVWTAGRRGKWIRGMEKNAATPQRRYGEIPGEKMVFYWRKWTRREKAHKKSNENKAKYIIVSPFCFPFPPQLPPETEPILFLAFQTGVTLTFTKFSFSFFYQNDNF